MIYYVIYFVITTILTLALAPKPPKPKAATLTDFQLPTADQGRNIPVTFGTVNITGSNCVWFGDLITTQIRVHSLFHSSVTGYQYFLGIHLVLGHGPFDSMNKVYWDKKLTWKGDASGNPMTASGQICMSWLNLFGGRTTGSGGIQGCFDLIMGADDEPQNTYLGEVLGTLPNNLAQAAQAASSDEWFISPFGGGGSLPAAPTYQPNVPNFRGVTSMVWIGGNRAVVGNVTQSDYTIEMGGNPIGCGYIGTSPNIKALEFECTRILKGWNIPGGCWYPEKAVITQSTLVTSPPTWNPTFEYQIYYQAVDFDAVTLIYDPTNQNFSAATQGYINIQGEWMQVTGVQLGTSGQAAGSQIGRMNVIRGVFGTTPAPSYAIGTPYYFYATATGPVQAMNAAHIVYQCLTDPRWGLGLSVAFIDDVAFRAAADTFYAENMGLCMQWVNASTVQDFLKIVLDHCAANLVMINATGLYSLVPIRGGYNAATLATFDESRILEMTEFDTQGWADEVNTVTLVYTDPGTRVDTGIVGQDLANLDLQGKVVSQVAHYGGIRSHELAANVLGRELMARCTPLIKVKFSINRSAWAVNTAGLFKLNWAARQVSGLVMRITNVDKGKLDDNTIVIDAVQDIYSLGLYNYQVSSVITGGGNSPTVQLTAIQITKAQTPAPPSGPVVLSATLTVPPSAPYDGDRYIVAKGATGAWAGEDGQVAIWDSPLGAWVFVAIPEGTNVFNKATGSYVTTNATGTVVDASNIGGIPTAAEVTYDATRSGLGATNVQDAIDVLAENAGSTINIQAYSQATQLWYAATFDGTLFTTADGLNYLTVDSAHQTSFKDLVYIQPDGRFVAIAGETIGYSDPPGKENLFGSWVYGTPLPGTAWEGLRYFPDVGLLAVFSGNTILTQDMFSGPWGWDGITTPPVYPNLPQPQWDDVASSLGSYAAAVLVYHSTTYNLGLIGYYRFGEDANLGTDEIGGNDMQFSGAYSTVPGVITTGTGLQFAKYSSGVIKTPNEDPVNLLTGFTPFTIVVWIQSNPTTVTDDPLTIFSQEIQLGSDVRTVLNLAYWPSAMCTGGPSPPACPKGRFVMGTGYLATPDYRVSAGSVGVALSGNLLYSENCDLYDGEPHMVVATREGKTGTLSVYLDTNLVGQLITAVSDCSVTFSGTWVSGSSAIATIVLSYQSSNSPIQSQTFTLEMANYASFDGLAADFASRVNASTFFGTATATGGTCTVTTQTGVISVEVSVNSPSANVTTITPASPITEGSSAYYCLDVYEFGTDYQVPAPDESPLYARTLTNDMYMEFVVYAYDPVENTRIAMLQRPPTLDGTGAGLILQPPQGGFSAVLGYPVTAGLTTRVSTLEPLTGIQTVLSDYIQSATIGQLTDTSPNTMTRPAVVIVMKPGYYLDTTLSAWMMGDVLAELTLLQPGTAAYPGGAKQASYVSFVDAYAANTYLSKLAVGQVYTITINGTLFSHTVQAAELADSFYEYNTLIIAGYYRDTIYNDLIAQIVATGNFTVTTNTEQINPSGPPRASNVFINGITITALAVNVPFTITASVTPASPLSLSSTNYPYVLIGVPSTYADPTGRVFDLGGQPTGTIKSAATGVIYASYEAAGSGIGDLTSGGNSTAVNFDELSIHTTCMTPAQISALYTVGSAGLPSQFGIVEILFDPVDNEMRIFGNLKVPTATGFRSVPKVYSADFYWISYADGTGVGSVSVRIILPPKFLAQLGLDVNFGSEGDGGTDTTVVAAATLPYDTSLPASHAYLGYLYTMFRPLSAQFSLISAITFYEGTYFVFGAINTYDSVTYTSGLFNSNWSPILPPGPAPVTPMGSAGVWDQFVQVVVNPPYAYVCFTVENDSLGFGIDAIDMRTGYVVGGLFNAARFGVSSVTGEVYFGVLDNSLIHMTAYSPTLTDPVVWVVPPFGTTGSPPLGSSGLTPVIGTVNYYLPAGGGFYYWPIAGATSCNLFTCPGNEGVVVGSYLYILKDSTLDKTLIRYDEATLTLDTTFVSPAVGPIPLELYNSDGGRNEPLMGEFGYIFRDGNFLSVAGVFGFVVDLTDEANPVFHAGSRYGVIMNDSAATGILAVSLDRCNTWKWSYNQNDVPFSPPIQAPPHGLDCLVYDGKEFVVTGEGWSGTSSDLINWTFTNTPLSGIPYDYAFQSLYPNGGGTIGAQLSIGGGLAVAGSAFSGTLVGTTEGQIWILGSKFKGRAADITYDDTNSDVAVPNVQSAITLLGSSWDIIKNQIFGD